MMQLCSGRGQENMKFDSERMDEACLRMRDLERQILSIEEDVRSVLSKLTQQKLGDTAAAAIAEMIVLRIAALDRRAQAAARLADALQQIREIYCQTEQKAGNAATQASAKAIALQVAYTGATLIDPKLQELLTGKYIMPLISNRRKGTT